MHDILIRQRQAQYTEGTPGAAVRIDRLDRAIGMLVDHARDIADALRDDFGHRSIEGSLITDVAAAIEPLKHAKRHVRRWMRRERRAVTPAALALLGARAWVDYQPKGVVGVIAPWNFPINLTFSPLAGILAAGNRAMIKPSEFTPRTSALMQSMVAKVFDAVEVSVITGDQATGEAFAALPFDHLLFTGATHVAKHVMRSAADNLVPVTLELGGKSPAIIGPDADLDMAASRLLFGKTLNAGQVCIAPDYALVPKDKVDAFVASLARGFSRMFPSLEGNGDYTSVISERHLERLQDYLADARGKGAIVRSLYPAADIVEGRKLPLHVVLDASDDMRIMQEEIFGPVLPVVAYDRLDDATAYVNERTRPLALYYFGSDRATQERVLSGIVAGGVTINDTIMHLTMDNLPFGGIGPSGMGAYHGIDGFRTFSHARGVYRQGWLDAGKFLRPPYGNLITRVLNAKIRR